MAPLSMLMKVEQIAGSPLPSYIFTSEIVTEICKKQTSYKPAQVSMFSEHECVVKYLTDITITDTAVSLTKVTHWLGFVVEINYTIAKL